MGVEFGTILNSGLDRPVSALIPMTFYLLGMLVPIVAIVGIIELVPAVSRLVEHRATRWTAIGLGAGLAVVVLFGAYPTLLSELARRSTL